MEHSHSNNNNIRLGKAFKLGIAVNIVFVIIEVSFGLISNSIALVADAGHNFGDVLALIFSWTAVILSQRKPTLKFTYGFRRSTILIALLNTIILLTAVVFIIWEMIERLGKPALINSTNVIIVAAAGIVINGITALLFIKGRKRDLNIRSAFIHFLADAIVSSGVVLSGIIISLTGISSIDSLMSIAIIAVILYSSYKLLMGSIHLALDAVPENIIIQDIRDYLQSLPEVIGLHDLHIWALSTTDTALTVHLTTNRQTDMGFINSIQRKLHNQFDIEHMTIQVEFGNKSSGFDNNCN
jgi:cobalt-zinc-cadmium efflux system protein